MISRMSILTVFFMFFTAIAFSQHQHEEQTQQDMQHEMMDKAQTVGTEKTAGENLNFKTFETALRENGLTIRETQVVEQPFFENPAKGVVVDHEQMIQVFEFKDSQDAVKTRAKVSSDGMTIGTSKPFWAEPPHFFAGGKLIVLYVGKSEEVLKVLSKILGPQFAGK